MSISLVTGGSGFIGQHLVDQLIADGEKVRILDLEPPSRRHHGVKFIQGSITDPCAVEEAISGVHHVYHTAAIPYLWMPDPGIYQETNVVGTKTVLEAAHKAGVERIVHTSSAAVLIDNKVGREPTTIDENHQTREQDLAGHYARSKWRAERVASSYMDKLSVVIVMPTLPLGPGDRHLTPPGRMLLDFLTGKNRAYTDCILNIIDVRDVAAGIRLAGTKGRSGQRYILNRHSLRMPSFLECLKTSTNRPIPKWKVPGNAALIVSAALEAWSNLISGKAPLAPLAGTRMGLRPIVFDNRLAATELGLPTTPLLETLRDAVVWLANEGYLLDDTGGSTLVLGKR